MSDLDTGHISTVFSACNDVGLTNLSPDEIETVLQPRLSQQETDNASTNGHCDDPADRVRIHEKTPAQQQLTFTAWLEGQCTTSKRARLAHTIHRLKALGLITHRERHSA